MTFGQAIEELKQGKKMRRSFWAPDMYICIQSDIFIMRYLNYRKEKLEFPCFCSADYLADDWEVYE